MLGLVPGALQEDHAVGRGLDVVWSGNGPSPFLILFSMWTCDYSGSSLPHHLLLSRNSIMSLVDFERKTGNALFGFCLRSLEISCLQGVCILCCPPRAHPSLLEKVCPSPALCVPLTRCLRLPNPGLP